MKGVKQAITAGVGAVFSICGAVLRLSAATIAWPQSYSYAVPRENTVWAIRERTYEDVGLALLVFGLAVLLVVLASWLRDSSGSDRTG